jgi:hypothetical protein
MTAQPSLFALASRYVVEVWNRRIDYAVVIDQTTGQAVATGTAAACEEMAASLRQRQAAVDKAAGDEGRGVRG